MSANPLFILLSSDEHEKIQMAAMVASVAAVSNRPVQILVSMNAVFVFLGDTGGKSRYKGGEFSRLMREKNVPDAIKLFKQGKELGGLSIYLCSMALEVMGGEIEIFEEGVFDDSRGLTQFLSDAENGELITI